MAMGIHAMADLAGVDVGARVRQERRSEIAHDPTYQAVQDRLFESRADWARKPGEEAMSTRGGHGPKTLRLFKSVPIWRTCMA